MKNKRSALSHEDEQEIIAHIRDAKNKKEQVKIEADLHLTSPEIIKDMLREAGWNLRCLNGGTRKKKGGISVGLGDDNPNEAWTPSEAETVKQDIITPVEEIKAAEERVDEEQVDFDLSYKRFKELLRERKHHEERLMELNTEILMYQDVCHCIILDLKAEGLVDEK